MEREQKLHRRERNMNTSDRFLTSLGVSAVVHLIVIVGVILFSSWTYKPKIIVPGYKVSLVTEKQASGSLLSKHKPKPKPKPKKTRVKKAKKKKKKKAKLKIKEKTKKSAKKIVPKVEKPKEKPKKEKEEKKEEPKEVKKEKKESGKPVTSEGEELKYIWYLKIVERKVTDHWITRGIDITQKTGDPMVAFSIVKNGSAVGILIEKSSGVQDLDSSAVQAVRDAAPFPPLPDGYDGDSMPIHFGFEYEQND